MKQITKRQAELLIDPVSGSYTTSRVGRYSDAVTAALAKKKAGELVKIPEIAKVQFGRKAREGSYTEQYIRRRLTKAVNMLLDAGIPAYPEYDTGGFHQKIGIKVVSQYNEEDYRKLTDYKNAAVARGDLSDAKAQLVEKAMENLRPPDTQPPQTKPNQTNIT